MEICFPSQRSYLVRLGRSRDCVRFQMKYGGESTIAPHSSRWSLAKIFGLHFFLKDFFLNWFGGVGVAKNAEGLDYAYAKGGSFLFGT